jgi:hypothetical protein
MQISKGKHLLIKNDIPGNINTTSRNIEALKPFVHRTIAQKSTTFGTKSKFVSIVGPKIGPTCTSKNSKHGIIRFVMEQDLKRVE